LIGIVLSIVLVGGSILLVSVLVGAVIGSMIGHTFRRSNGLQQ
jgi:hypothetical protein